MNDRAFPMLDAHCPACGERKLYRGFRGVITCSSDKCPNPEAVHQLLADPTVAHHLILVSEVAWTLRHPVIERIGRNGFSCPLGADLPKQREANSGVSPLAGTSWSCPPPASGGTSSN